MGPSPYPASACCPTAKDGPSTLGLRQQRKISTTPVPCAPHQEVSAKGLEHHMLHEGSVHRKRQESEKRIGAPTHPTVAQKPKEKQQTWEQTIINKKKSRELLPAFCRLLRFRRFRNIDFASRFPLRQLEASRSQGFEAPRSLERIIVSITTDVE